MSEDEGRRPPLSREASLAARGYNRLRYSVRRSQARQWLRPSVRSEGTSNLGLIISNSSLRPLI